MGAHAPGGVLAEHPPRPAPTFPGPVRVDGKQLARGGRRLRVQGVTYGPFPPGPALPRGGAGDGVRRTREGVAHRHQLVGDVADLTPIALPALGDLRR